jgi:TatD DNase family protein
VHLIDTHCHLNLADAFPDPDGELMRCRDAGVGVIMVGLDPPTSWRALELAQRHENAWAIVGRHPNYAHRFDLAELEDYRKMLAHPKAVALGEIGLDFHWDFATYDQQEQVLLAQLDLAEELKVPVVFHCREAYAALLDILEGEPRKLRFLFHCFSGTQEDAARALALGAFFGVDGPITYPKADTLRQVVASLPRDRVVLETDSPYMTPVPYRGKPNHPVNLPLIAEALAHLWQCSAEEAAAQTTNNARMFFGL